MRKFASLLTVTLFIFPLGGASYIANHTHSSSRLPTLAATAEEPHSTIIAEQSDEMGDGSPTLLATSTTFPTGQGSMSFNYQATSNSTDAIRIYVKNNSTQAIRFILTAPNGTAWIEGEIIKPGQSFTTNYKVDASLAGEWFMKFDNSDGSSISVDIDTSYEI